MTIVLIILLVLLLGGGGFYGVRNGYGGTGLGLGGILILLLIVWLLFGGTAHAADATASLPDATSATATISLLPLWLQIIPYIAYAVGAVVMALAGMVVTKLTGKHLSDADNARLQQAATNAAGRVLAQLNGPISTFSIDTTHPLIAEEAKKLMDNLGETIGKLGLTPERVAALVLGKVGQLQAASPLSALTTIAPNNQKVA